MTPERELLLQQATACRQLAMIADAGVAEKLKGLAAEYETIARINQTTVAAGSVSNQETANPTS
jgi:hypothetical protein